MLDAMQVKGDPCLYFSVSDDAGKHGAIYRKQSEKVVFWRKIKKI
jgi:hypothetical protein